MSLFKGFFGLKKKLTDVSEKNNFFYGCKEEGLRSPKLVLNPENLQINPRYDLRKFSLKSKTQKLGLYLRFAFFEF